MRTLFAILISLMIPFAAAGDDYQCETSETDVDTGDTPAGRYYVVNDDCQPHCLFSVWVYQESNGQDGLQRGDQTMEDDGTWCEYDTIVF